MPVPMNSVVEAYSMMANLFARGYAMKLGPHSLTEVAAGRIEEGFFAVFYKGGGHRRCDECDEEMFGWDDATHARSLPDAIIRAGEEALAEMEAAERAAKG